MSFSYNVKEEVLRLQENDTKNMFPELSAIIRTCGSIELHGGLSITVKISSESATIIKKVYILLKSLFNIRQEVGFKKNRNLNKKNLYILRIDTKDALNVLEKCGIININNDTINICYDIPGFLIKSTIQKRAYMRGAFIGSGSLTDPKKGYHMEIVTHNEDYANCLKNIFYYFDMKAKIIARKNNYIVYLKEGEQIVTFLNVIGAYNALLDFENVRVIKDVRNNVNRVVNCETANLNKTVDASVRQIENIQYIEKTIGLKSLPEDLYDIAMLRLKNKDVSLKELGMLLKPSLGKSGVNHRLKKIEDIAESIKDKRGDIKNV